MSILTYHAFVSTLWEFLSLFGSYDGIIWLFKRIFQGHYESCIKISFTTVVISSVQCGCAKMCRWFCSIPSSCDEKSLQIIDRAWQIWKSQFSKKNRMMMMYVQKFQVQLDLMFFSLISWSLWLQNISKRIHDYDIKIFSNSYQKSLSISGMIKFISKIKMKSWLWRKKRRFQNRYYFLLLHVFDHTHQKKKIFQHEGHETIFSKEKIQQKVAYFRYFHSMSHLFTLKDLRDVFFWAYIYPNNWNHEIYQSKKKLWIKMETQNQW